MTFKPKIWYPIAAGLSAVNVVSVWFAAQPAEPWHATIHAALAVAFGLWAQRLRQGPGGVAVQARSDAFEAEVNTVRQELIEAQGRLDFVERLLVQEPEARRVGPQR